MLTFGNFPEQRSRKRCFLPTVEMKDYNGIVDGRNSFDKPIKINREHTIGFERLQIFKEMAIQLVVYFFII